MSAATSDARGGYERPGGRGGPGEYEQQHRGAYAGGPAYYSEPPRSVYGGGGSVTGSMRDGGGGSAAGDGASEGRVKWWTTLHCSIGACSPTVALRMFYATL